MRTDRALPAIAHTIQVTYVTPTIREKVAIPGCLIILPAHHIVAGEIHTNVRRYITTLPK